MTPPFQPLLTTAGIRRSGEMNVMGWCSFSRCLGSWGFRSSVFVAMVYGVGATAQAPPFVDATPILRVRSTDTAIAALIDRAAKDSETFYRLRETIQHSNGIVYIEPGNCGHGARACLKLSVVANGPDRFLRILVDRHNADSDVDFIGSLGHELQHAIEALSRPSITNGAQLYNFFRT
jgi:hypothetical protein